MCQAQSRRQIPQASLISPPDVLIRHIVSSLCESRPHSLDILLGTANTDIHETNHKSTFTRDFHGFEVSTSGERRLNAKALAGLEVPAGSQNCFPASRHCGPRRVSRIDPLGDGIRIKEIIPTLEPEFASEGTLTGTVWPR